MKGESVSVTRFITKRVWLSERNACLTIDTIQLGEIEGIHTGLIPRTCGGGVPWLYAAGGSMEWHARHRLLGKPTRGGSGRGDGAFRGRGVSWWIAALDERVKAVVPVAGITVSQHVSTGAWRDCDCMYP